MPEATLSVKNQIVIPREAREALGLKPGPEVGRLLAEVRDLQLQETITNRDQALAWVKKQLASV